MKLIGYLVALVFAFAAVLGSFGASIRSVATACVIAILAVFVFVLRSDLTEVEAHLVRVQAQLIATGKAYCMQCRQEIQFDQQAGEFECECDSWSRLEQAAPRYWPATRAALVLALVNLSGEDDEQAAAANGA